MTTLNTSHESINKDQVKLRVEVPEAELAPAISAIYKRWAKEIKIPGFRAGKVPRQLIDARVGPEAIREEALREALPDLYRDGLRAEGLEAIAPPEIEITQFEDGRPVVFEATVDIRPEVKLPDLSSISITSPPAEVTDEELADQLDRLRDRFAELESVAREARRGDHVLIDLNGYQKGELVEGLSAPDYLYEVGSQAGPKRLDEELEGARAGAILKFTDPVVLSEDAEPVDIGFTVLVKEVKAKKLLPLDDEFAKTVGEFGSLEELKADLRARFTEMKIGMVLDEIRGLALNALVEAADIEAPEKLVEGELQHRLQHVEEDLKSAGLTLAQYAERSGSTELEVRSDMRTQAERSVKAELLLEEIARSQDIEVTQDDIGLEIAYAASRANQDPKEVAEQLVSSGRLSALASDILRRKALDHVVDNIKVEGRPEMPAPPVADATAQDDAEEMVKTGD
ncbi:MAG: trigger factor [Actinomycetota bacterium]